MTREEMMQAKAEIESKHITRAGVIKTPGKFCGEPVWAVLLYDWWLDGSYADKAGRDQESGENAWAAFTVDDDMRAVFPDLDASTFAVGIEESDQGFIYSRELTEEEFNNLGEQEETEESREEDDPPRYNRV